MYSADRRYVFQQDPAPDHSSKKTQVNIRTHCLLDQWEENYPYQTKEQLGGIPCFMLSSIHLQLESKDSSMSKDWLT